jgi:hypothetical protein
MLGCLLFFHGQALVLGTGHYFKHIAVMPELILLVVLLPAVGILAREPLTSRLVFAGNLDVSLIVTIMIL